MTAPPVRFLADESCDFAVVRILRRYDYDVVPIAETTRRMNDPEVIKYAVSEKRVLLTEDKDFGRLVFASHMESTGVILIRFPGSGRQTLPGAILDLVQQQGERLLHSFVVIQPGYARISRWMEEGS